MGALRKVSGFASPFQRHLKWTADSYSASIRSFRDLGIPTKVTLAQTFPENELGIHRTRLHAPAEIPSGNTLDQFGHRTPTWSHLQNVSQQLTQLAPTLRQLTSQRVYHIGDLPAMCRPAPDSAWVRAVHAQQQEFVVGEFVHNQDASRWLILVNKRLRHSSHYTLELAEPGLKLARLSPFNGSLLPLGGEDGWLAPGQGAVLRIDSGD